MTRTAQAHSTRVLRGGRPLAPRARAAALVASLVLLLGSGFVEQDVGLGWRVQARETVLHEPAEQPPPGADRLEVRIVEAGDQVRSGVPDDPGPWLQIAREIDSRARGELATERQEP